jgi:hypothetical protein
MEAEEMNLMKEEERKRQRVLAEERLNMADLRKGGPSALRRINRKKGQKGA